MKLWFTSRAHTPRPPRTAPPCAHPIYGLRRRPDPPGTSAASLRPPARVGGRSLAGEDGEEMVACRRSTGPPTWASGCGLARICLDHLGREVIRTNVSRAHQPVGAPEITSATVCTRNKFTLGTFNLSKMLGTGRPIQRKKIGRTPPWAPPWNKSDALPPRIPTTRAPLQQISHILRKPPIKGIRFIFFPPTIFQLVYSWKCCSELNYSFATNYPHIIETLY